MAAKSKLPRGVRKSGKRFARLDCKGSLEGWKAIVLENELLKVTILPEHGGWILSAFYKPRQVDLLWRSPRGLLAKDDPPVVPESSLGFRARSPGGWPELFPHGSAAADVCGVRMPFHGEAVNRVWKFEPLRAPPGEVAVRMWVDCNLQPLRLERTLRIKAGQATLILDERVTNRCGLRMEFMWGHHPYFGKPVFSGSSRIFAPATKSLSDNGFAPGGWPVREGKDLSRCPAERAGTGEMFYLTDFAEGWYALVNPAEKLGLAMSWDRSIFPYVWIWREANASQGYPYFGGAYTVAIEPFSSLPGARANGGRLLHLDGHATLSTRLCFSAFQGLTQVAAVDREGRVTGSR
jgi:galactose mutarotase-like enzyme